MTLDDTTGNEPVELVVLFGGRSAEHDVSRVTARHVLDAVNPERYRIRAVGISRDGAWIDATDAARAAPSEHDAHDDGLAVDGPEIDVLSVLCEASAGSTVVVLPLLHGPLGEDGTVQGLLELADVAYVGSGVVGSAAAMDKSVAKDLLAAHGLPQGAWRSLRADEIDDERCAELVEQLGLPLFVKPANMGSSIGITRVTSADALSEALALAASYDESLVVEESVEGRELECAVLGSPSDLRTAPPGEVVPGADFYDYADKYRTGAATLHIPASLSPDVADELRSLAVATFRALRCEGMARVDFFFEEPGRGLLINEVNTIPGFTPISMYPKMWQAAGLDYPQLIDELVRLALERHGRRRRRTDVG